MNYFQVVFSLPEKEGWKTELFKDALLQAGFDSFADNSEGFEAYAPQNDFKAKLLPQIIEESYFSDKDKIKYDINFIEDQNWNFLWEETSPSVRFSDKCFIHRSNQAKENVLYDIIINPRQSFGTATHPTTYMIIDLLLSMDMEGKQVMDMGCGTGVLGILAKKMGAAYVESIDIDSWAYANTLENALSNNVILSVKQGGAEVISEDKGFDIFIANINLNILKENLRIYNRHIKNGAFLILSGFYIDNTKEMQNFADKLGYQTTEIREKETWALILLQKIND